MQRNITRAHIKYKVFVIAFDATKNSLHDGTDKTIGFKNKNKNKNKKSESKC